MSAYGYRRRYDRRSGNNRYGYRTEYVDVPPNACGLIVGKGGRNVKELQQMSGIEHIRVDFERGSVKIVGNEAGIVAVKHRIDQAIVLAVNSDGYFPEATLTCLLLSNYTAIKFQRVSKAREYVVRSEQLDANRQYFSFDSLDVDLDERLDALDLAKHNAQTGESDFVAGFDPSHYMLFFGDVIRKNLSELSDASVSTSIGVNFGKTFVSSVPEDKQGRTLSLDEVFKIGYGRRGLRPEFVRNFNLDKRASLSSAIEGEYEELSSGKFIVVHCVSQRSKKRYNIKFRLNGSKVDANPTSDIIKRISTAKTYFSVLGVPSNATIRQIRIAFRRKALEVHPDKNADVFAEKAMKIVNEAWECLQDNSKRAAYLRLPPSEQRPENVFKYSSVTAEPFPEIESFKSRGRRLALCTVLKAATQSEFRTTIETARDEAVDHTMLRKLQNAWDERSDDGKMRFPDGTGDWLIVETVRYKKRMTLTNGTFILTMDEVTEDHFSKSCDGIHISLESYDVNDTLEFLPRAADKDGATCRLLSYVRDLQHEATKLSSLLDEA